MRGWNVAGAAVALAGLLVGSITTGGAGPAAADAGDLDTSFGAGGTVVTDPLGIGDNDRTSAIAVQPDGKVVVSTDLTGNGTFSGPLVRYNTDGSLDEGFGTGGVVRTDAGGCVFCGADMALQPDGKILVAGAGVLSFALFWTPTVARFNRDGTVDTDFGAGGLGITSPPYPMGAADAVAVQPDGAILMLVTGSPMTVTRFNPDGSPDTSWGEDGRAYAAAGVSPDEPIYATDLAVQPDGGVVAAGKIMTSGDDPERRIVLARLQPDGSVDRTFGDNGVVQTRELVDVEHVAGQPDGKIVAAGLAGSQFGLLRFDPDGAIDRDFGDNGLTIAADQARGVAVAVRPDGRIVAAGDNELPGTGTVVDTHLLVAAFTPDGRLSPAFGTDGVATVDVVEGEADEYAADVALDAQGRILVGGVASTASGNRDVAVSRLLSNEPPTIALAGRGMCSGDAGATLGLAVADAETPAEDLVVTARSSDTAALPDSSLRLGGEGAGRSLTVTPPSRSSGRSEVTVMVDDGEDTDAVTLEAVVGTQGQDRLLGTGTSDVIVARQGNDTLSGDDGKDLLCGGRGDDVLSGDAGDDHIMGDRGDDSLTGGDGADFFNGGQGADVMADLTSSEGDEEVG
jgi:uncharacterized delta-60 repeat protein